MKDASQLVFEAVRSSVFGSSVGFYGWVGGILYHGLWF